MFTSTVSQNRSECQTTDVLVPLIRAAATIGFAVAPCSLGFVIVAVSEQLIRSIMVGDDPEQLVSDLQKKFPDSSMQVVDRDEDMMTQVVNLIDGPGAGDLLPVECGEEFAMSAWDALYVRPDLIQHERA